MKNSRSRFFTQRTSYCLSFLLFLALCLLAVFTRDAEALFIRSLVLTTDKTNMAVDLLESDPLGIKVSGFLANDVVRVGVYVDVNRNGVIDANEPLVACYKLMDGQLPKIGGVRNGNVPGDEDGLVNGSISTILRGAAAGQISALEGDVILKAWCDAEPSKSVTKKVSVRFPDQAQRIIGTVMDTQDRPVAGAVVMCSTHLNGGYMSTYSFADSAGQFSIPAAPGTYRLTYAASSYWHDPMRSTSTVDLKAGKDAYVNGVVCEFTPTRTVSGRVLTKDTSEPIAGLMLFMGNASDKITYACTGVDGSFSINAQAEPVGFDIPADALSAYGLVWALDSSTPKKPVSLGADLTAGSVSNLELRLAQTADALMTGKLQGSDGVALAGTHLRSRRYTGYDEEVGTEARVLKDGTFWLATYSGSFELNVEDDEWGVYGLVSSPVYDGSSRISISSGAALQAASAVSAQVGGVTVRGSVTDLQGRPLTLMRYEGSQNVSLKADGSFQMRVWENTPSTFHLDSEKGYNFAPGVGDLVVPSVVSGSVWDAGTIKVSVNDPSLPRVLLRASADAVAVGSTTTLTADAAGGGTMTYKWYVDGVRISGQSGSSLVLVGTLTAGASVGTGRVATVGGNYVVEVSNSIGRVASQPYLIGVKSQSAILTQPRGGSVPEGAPFVLAVAVGGAGPITYQWRKDGINIPGATGPTFTLAAAGRGALVTDSGVYDVVVSSAAFGEESSDSVLVSVLSKVAIQMQPVGLTLGIGETGSLGVVATGSGSLSYQWYKNGVLLSGATGATLALNSASESTAGFYKVLVSNSVSALESESARVDVNVPVAILKQPTAAALIPGSGLRLSVLTKGSGPLSFKWFKDGNVISDANEATLEFASLTIADEGTYAVEVSNAFSTKRSNEARVRLLAGREGIQIRKQPVDSVLVQGTGGSLRVEVEPAVSGVIRTTYQWVALSSGVTAPVGITEMPESGEVDVPLRAITQSGDYVLRITRTWTDGTVSQTDSQPFNIGTRSWTAAAGSYEALLEDSNGAVSDGAVFRGFLGVTVSKTGSVSGRVLYNEALPLDGAETLQLHVYSPTTRAFSGTFAPVPGEPLRFTCSPKLGSGAQAIRAALALELNFSVDPPILTARMSDYVSASGGQVCESQATTQRLATQLPDSLKTRLPGRYTISADALDPSLEPDNNAYVLVQVLASGKALWTSRLKSYSGSGAATLNTAFSAAPAMSFYEGRQASSATFTSTSLIGRVDFGFVSGNTWKASFADIGSNGQLERQASKVDKDPVTKKLSYGDGSKFDTNANFTGIRKLNFSKGNGCRWADANVSALPALIPANVRMLIGVSDPQADGTALDYRWSVSASNSGMLKVSGVPDMAGSMPPTLSLRLDRARGEWTGSYTVAGKRRTLVGASITSEGDPLLRGGGWVEWTSGSKVITGPWSLSLP